MNRIFDKWKNIKKRHSERIVLVHAGGYYTTFDNDAEKIHEICNIALHKAKNEFKAYEKFAYFVTPSLDSFLTKMIANGQRICTTDM